VSGTSLWFRHYDVDCYVIIRNVLDTNVGFEVLTEVVVKSQPTFRRNISPPTSGSNNKAGKKPGAKQGSASTLKMEAYVFPKRRLIFNGLHGVISQKIVLFNIRWESNLP
jgi:hypothetical protein